MMSDRPTVWDVDLGECVVFGGSRSVIMCFGGLGALFLFFVAQSALGIAGRDAMSASQMAGAAGLAVAAWLVAAGFWRTRLMIGALGFRYVMPFRSLRLSWGQVSSIEVVSRGKGDALVVRLGDAQRTSASRIRIGGIASFSAANSEICDLMNTRRAAFGTVAAKQPLVGGDGVV